MSQPNDQLTFEESRTLTAAIFQAMEDGDRQAADELAALAQDPARVRAVLLGDLVAEGQKCLARLRWQKRLVSVRKESPRQPGVPFQGQSGRWFVVRQEDGRVVPTAAPSEGTDAGQPAAHAAEQKPPAQPSPSASEPVGSHPGASHGSKVRVEKTDERAAPRDEKGRIKPVATKVKLTKQETGRVAEATINAFLRDVEGVSDMRALNAGKANESIDAFGDHMAPEIKGGLCSNGTGAQQWRITFSMELGQQEQAEYDAMDEQQQKAWREKKQRACLERKTTLLARLSEETGTEIKPVTYTAIINPDTRVVDVYRTEGYHQRLGWNDPAVQFVGSVRYHHAE